MSTGNAAGYRVGIDIGGTFTDIVVHRPGKILRRKVPSSPQDYSLAIGRGLGELLTAEAIVPSQIAAVVHGTTVATNAILENRGARTALATTLGFRDVLELRRIRVPELYNFNYVPPPPLVPRRLRFEVRERIGADGKVRTALDEADAAAVLDRIAASGVEALAIAFLHSYANPEHERRFEAMARARLGAGVFICSSAETLPEIREYERTSTVVINAYIGPVVERYLRSLQRVLRDLGIAAPLHVMQSNGGILSAEAVLKKPAFIVESGPAAGAIGGAALSRRSGGRNLLTIDMGGTTAKASMVENGRLTKTSEYEVGAGINLSSHLVKGRGHALKLPVLDVSEIGAGGGSLAVVDETGLLHVGPQSAGAYPGPVCYGQGGEIPTLTDAMLVLGYINPHHLAGGEVRLRPEPAQQALATRIAAPLGCDTVEAAHGVYRIAAATMTRAVKAVSTFRGRDPRDFSLCAFGGNGPLMAAAIAEALHVREVVVPPLPGVFSAYGLLLARLEQEFSHSLMRRLDAVDRDDLAERFAGLERRARTALIEDGCAAERVAVERFADLRYSGQAYELTVPVAAGGELTAAALAEAFGAEHERTYGHRATDEPIDLVSLRVTASEHTDGAGFDGAPSAAERNEAASRSAYFGARIGRLDTAVIGRAELAAAPRSGPAIIEEYDATCLVPPGWMASLDPLGNIVLRAEAQR